MVTGSIDLQKCVENIRLLLSGGRNKQTNDRCQMKVHGASGKSVNLLL